MTGRGGIRAWSLTRVGNWGLTGAMLGTLTILMGPWVIETNREWFVHNYELKDPDLMPILGTQYWMNEWRKGAVAWRRGEHGVKDFFAENFVWAKKCTGKDLWKPSTWFKKTADQKAPRAFVPLCGDSPMVGELAKMNYEVDAVDVSDCAIRSLVERIGELVPVPAMKNIHLHLDDFFGAEFWRKMGATKFDLIYDRQGITAVNPRDRADYAFLLRRALKPDGVIVIEGAFRTPHVAGNKFKGPPFDVTEDQLKELFPTRDGFVVKCQDVSDDYKRDFGPAARVTGKIYKEHWVSMFPCVAYRDATAAAEQKQV